MAKILIIDDETSILESLEMFLAEKGHIIFKADRGKSGRSIFQEKKPEIVILDIRLPDDNGLEMLKQMVKADYLVKVIMITAFMDMESTIKAMKQGAFDYIHKPLDVDEIEKSIESALNILAVEKETPSFQEPLDEKNPWVIIGKSQKMREIFKTIGLLCQNQATVLIQGETGTGKELIARVIHLNSKSQNEPFVVMDCSAVVETLLESELFGHEKGAFTGADRSKPGKVEMAGKGTLFLDEIAELSIGLQGKLLGFLQRREFMRVGGQKILQSKCRIIAACNRDLSEMVRNKTFKEDLFYRLRVVTLHVPPLRERLSDVPHLTNHFLQKINRDLGTQINKLQAGVMERLMTHGWTGNVRELENVIVQLLVGCRGNVIMTQDVDQILEMNGNFISKGLDDYSLANMEKNHIHKTLHQLNWNRTQAAKKLGISLPTLRAKIKKYQISPPIAM